MVVIQRGTTITSVIDMIISSDNQEGRRVIRQGREGCNAQSSNEVKFDADDDGHHHGGGDVHSGDHDPGGGYDDDVNAINVETGTPGTLLLHRGVAQETHR